MSKQLLPDEPYYHGDLRWLVAAVALLVGSVLTCMGADYQTAHDAALKAGKPLVVGVGCAPPAGDWVPSLVAKLPGYAAPCIVVAVPLKTWLEPVKVLSPFATASEIRAALGVIDRKVDVKPKPKIGWTWSADDVPEYMEPYRRAEFSQRIAVTNGLDTIIPVPRTNALQQWQVPGGLEGVAGWRSDLYRNAGGAPAIRRITDIAVWNGKAFQNNRGWTRRYDDGAEFLDVLTNTDSGKVFEVRKAIKLGGSWQRFTVYRDKAHWPSGYGGPAKLDCRGCHEQAGTGGYADDKGLIPGGDTVFSNPFPELEPEPQKQTRQPTARTTTQC